ncbi:MAG: hypothetical protein U0414_28630 [Polyangiaceae bacterium]
MLELRKRAPKAKVKKPAPSKKVAQLEDEAGPLPEELRAYFRVCDGVEPPLGPRLYSVDDMLGIDTPGFFAISGDDAGDYDLVAARFEPGAGAVVFWDHESGEVGPVLASSVTRYVEIWASRCPRSSADFEALAPLAPASRKKLDPAAVALSRSKTFTEQLGVVRLELVDRSGKSKPRVGINPFTKQPMTFPAAPSRRTRG